MGLSEEPSLGDAMALHPREGVQDADAEPALPSLAY